jgi:hypothetical protein
VPEHFGVVFAFDLREDLLVGFMRDLSLLNLVTAVVLANFILLSFLSEL